MLHAVANADTALTVVVRKATSESVTSSTALQNDDELKFPIGANEIWVVRFVLFIDGASAGDFRATVAGPSGATGQVGMIGTGSNATTFDNATFQNQANITVNAGTAAEVGTLGTGNINLAYVEATVVNSTTPGDVVLSWAQRVSSATATRVMANSFLVAYRVG